MGSYPYGTSDDVAIIATIMLAGRNEAIAVGSNNGYGSGVAPYALAPRPRHERARLFGYCNRDESYNDLPGTRPDERIDLGLD
jgi:hypothetical protein